MVDTFPSCNDLLSAVQRSVVGGGGEKHGYDHRYIVLYMADDFFFTVINN